MMKSRGRLARVLPHGIAMVLCGFAFCVLAAADARAEIRLPKFFGDHMVLQRDMAVPVWGWGDAGETVTVELAGQSAQAAAGADGRWMVRLPALGAGGPHELVVRGSSTQTIQDVYIGEVWICSGQSNMQWSVKQAANPDAEIAAANHPRLRMFTVEHTAVDEAQTDVNGAWQVCSPETVADFSAVGFFFARFLQEKLDLPIGMLNTSWGGTLCEAWTSHEALASVPGFEAILERQAAGAAQKQEGPHFASRLYNGMVHPLVPYAIRGAIWYQGESNVSRAHQYRFLFPTMIRDWRQAWGQGDFPFLFVQLAPFRYGGQDARNCAELWEAQLRTLRLPATGMAVTTDISDLRDIHPKNKQDVGKRLALWALARTYGQDIVHSGPLYKSMRVEGDTVRVQFDHVGGGLAACDSGPLREFTIAAEDQQFFPAEASIDGQEVVVHSPAVAKPVAVRFAWHDSAQPNLANVDGLPASPFRSDHWPLVTGGRE